MTITIGAWIIPAIFTFLCFVGMFWPYESTGSYDFTPLLRVFWLLPIGFIWAIYFAILYFIVRK
jgi:hypothetical protein